MSIQYTINLNTSGITQTISPTLSTVNLYVDEVLNTGTIGEVSAANPDDLFVTGAIMYNICTPVPVYKESLVSATLSIAGQRSELYSRPEFNRPPYAYVGSIGEMVDLQENPQEGATPVQKGDYVIFTEDDTPYEQGDKGAWNGSSWIRFLADEPIDITIEPTNPVNSIPVSIEVQDVINATPPATYTEFVQIPYVTGVLTNFNTQGGNTIDVTPILKYTTDKEGWQRFQRANILIKPTGVARMNREPFAQVSSQAEMLALPTQLPPSVDTLVSTAEVQTGSDTPLIGIIPVTNDFVVIDDRAIITVAQDSDIWTLNQDVVLTPSNVLRTNDGVVTGVIVTRDIPYFGVSSLSGIVNKQVDVNIDVVTEGDYVVFTEDDSPYEAGDRGAYNGTTWVREVQLNYLSDVGGVSPNNFTLNFQYNAVPPNAVQYLEVVSAFRSLDVFWEPPSDDGGSPIIDYDIQYQEDGYSEWQGLNSSVSTTSGTIPNLEPNKFYFVRVRANNAAGSGPWNTTSTPDTPNNTSPAPISSLDFNSANPIRVRIRRDLKANWDAADPILAIGEPGYELDTQYLKVGDGVLSWTGLPTIKVPDSTINFPVPPDISLDIKDDPTNAPAFSCNLSLNEALSLVAGSGMKLVHDPVAKQVTFSVQNTFDPIFSGTIVNPQSTGVPGTVSYDDRRIFICVEQNQWKRVLQEIPWFDFVPLDVSNGFGNYPSLTKITAEGSLVNIASDGDPYPALAGDPLTNDGFTPRGGFRGGYIPVDQTYDFAIPYKGGENTSNPMPVGSSPIAITVNGVAIKSPSYGDSIDIFAPPPGFEYNLVYWSRYFGMDDCNGLVMSDRAYIYYGGGFVSQCWNTQKFYEANDYFNNTNYNGDHMRHPDGHSKIIGLAFDGYPIYGPFGYTDALDTSSAVKRMETGYTELIGDSHRPNGFKYNNEYVIEDSIYPLVAGAFVQDFEFTSAGDLDTYNGRYCKTPDYPNGTYAYFLTFSDDGMLYPEYPYIIGSATREQRSV